MQRSRSLLGAYKLAGKPQAQHQGKDSALYVKRRGKWRRKGTRPIPMLDVPSVVLDLDAEDNPHVRQYDQVLEEEQAAKWSMNLRVEALSGRLDKFSQEVAQANSRMKSTASAFNPWRVTDRDILSVAFFGAAQTGRVASHEQPPSNESIHATKPSQISEVLHQNGIPLRVTHDDTSTIQFMLHRQSLARKVPLGSADEFEAAVASCQSLPEIQRLVSLAVHSPSGCDILLRCESALVESLSVCLTEQADETPENVSTLLLNLIYNLESKNSKISRDLCFLGLKASSATLEPAAIHRYLRIGLRDGYFHRHARDDAVATVLSDSLTAILEILQRPERRGPNATQSQSSRRWGTRADLFTALTGRSLVPSTEDVSFRAVLGNDFSALHKLYFAILGELGSLRTLWTEYRSWADKAPEEWRQSAGDVFATAVIRYAGYSLNTKEDSTKHIPIKLAEASDNDENALHDLQTIRIQDAGLERTAAETGYQPSPYLPGPSAIDDEFRAEAVLAFTRESIQDAMKDIQPLVDRVRKGLITVN